MNWAWFGGGILTGWAWITAGLLVAVPLGQRLRKRPAPGHPPQPTPPTAARGHAFPSRDRAPVPGPEIVMVNGKEEFAPLRARENYRAPGGEDLGPCHATIHHCARGVIIHDHALRRKIVIQGAPRADELSARRLGREVRDQ